MSEEEVLIDVAAIGEKYEDKGYFRRLGEMFSGLGKPHDTPEYKKARFELQRQAAPLIAFVSVILFVIVLVVVTALQKDESKGYEITVHEQEEEPPPPDEQEEVPPDPPPDPEPQPMDDLQTPVDRPADPSPVSNITPMPSPPVAPAIISRIIGLPAASIALRFARRAMRWALRCFARSMPSERTFCASAE